MALGLNNRTKLTTQAEKLLVEMGGGDPSKTLNNRALGECLAEAIALLAERQSPILVKLYRQYEAAGKLPPLESLSAEAADAENACCAPKGGRRIAGTDG